MLDGHVVRFDDFVRERTEALLRVAYRHTGDQHVAEDLLQEVLEQMYARWPLIHTAPEAYARRALVNRSTNRWRARARRPEAALAHHDVAERDHSDDVVTRDALLDALRALPPKQRAAIVLRYLEDLPVVEVARALDISEGTVKSNAARGLDRLRAALAAGAIAIAVAASTVIALGLLPDSPPATPTPSMSALPDPWADDQWRKGPFPLLTRATRGDLAGDAAFLRSVVAAWRGFDSGLPLLGEPHVVWAGDTPAGPAAFVAQSGKEQWSPDVYGRLGYVEPGSDGPVVTSYHVLQEPWTTRRPPAMLIGERRDVLVVLDTGGPVDHSSAFVYAPDGRVARTWKRVTFTDGAAVIRVPRQDGDFTLGLAAPAHTIDDIVEIGNMGDLKTPDGTDRAPRYRRTLPGDGDPGWFEEARDGRWVMTGWERFDDAVIRHSANTSPAWDIWANTPDGRRLEVHTRRYGDDDPRIFYGLGTATTPPQVRYGGTVPAKVPLDVRLRLPDGQGVLVAAAEAGLRYRVGGGGWQDVEGDAALLPEAATAVQVTPPGGKATTVDLG